jgi:RNA polymerase sigma factor (sigma-70 family)
LSERPQIETFTDEELVDAFVQKADNKFLEVLYNRYIRFVFLICMKYLKNTELAKDVSMQVFEKLGGDLKRFEIRNFKSWLHVVTKNTCFMHLRSERDFQQIDLIAQKDLAGIMEKQSFMHPENDEENEIKYELLQKAMEKLNDEQKKCINLFYIEEKSYKEVSGITGFSLNEVKSHIQNGKRNLKNMLINSGELTLYCIACFLFGR